MRMSSFLTGAILGAGAMYFLDPRLGRRRRVTVEDQLRHLSRRAACGIDAGMRDLGNRAAGTMHDIGSLIGPRAAPNEHRQRSQAGRVRRFKWTPGPRLVAAATGTALMANCAACRTPGAVLLGTLGFGLFAQAVSDPRGGVTIERAIEIYAPVGVVYEFFSNPENYLRISDVITNVEVFGDGRYAKDMSLAGIPIHFEERFTCMEKDCRLETHSEPGSALAYCKQMRFESRDENLTRMSIHFTYHPPGGIIGHTVATMLGIDPKSELVDLLMRAKYFLETGKEPHDAVARKRRIATSGNGNGRQRRSEGKRDESQLVMRGPGAPSGDVHGLIGSQDGQGTWPPARSTMPETAETTGPFPID